MIIDHTLFPSKPSYGGRWWSISFEPIVGSGERINVIIVAKGEDTKVRIIQSIRDEILDAIYGIKSDGIKDMIQWVRCSLQSHIDSNSSLDTWISPVGGFHISMEANALDDSLTGVLRQAVRLTASLGTLSLEAERNDEDDRPNEKQSEQWATRISDETKFINPKLADYFGARVQLSSVNVHTKFGFMNDMYASNFGLMVPSRLSSSLNSIKAKVYDLESLSRSSMVLKPQRFDIIVGIPSFDDPTIPPKTVLKMKGYLEEMTDLALSEGIEFFAVENAKQAALRVIKQAA
ncbi:hypothetical protein [Serratia sp. JSRIV004]|uniref:hypothetical protein n=1 Tax=Serratia sp. JSRIV004 TaxID=2831895 RepID=UPI001CBF716E|nr:hypothetical protein [Serratia sp. JSRIV004]UAN57420.1 hypothetical protein KGP21_28200 [Serratia sp. JSRIV004]